MMIPIENCYILPRVCPNFLLCYISAFWSAVPVNGTTDMGYLSYVESVLYIWEPLLYQIHDVIGLINIKPMSRLINPKKWYLGTYPSWILLSKYSSKISWVMQILYHCLCYLGHFQWRLWGRMQFCRKYLYIYGMVNCYFLVFYHYKHCI